MRVYTKHTGYKKNSARGRAQIKAHIKYLVNRPNEQGEREQREMFGADGPISREKFQEKLDKMAEKYPDHNGVLAHKIVISMKREDFEKAGIDPKELVRHALAEYEAATGRKLEWGAVFHNKESNPHGHIVILGRDKSGKEVKIDPKELEKIKNRIDKEFKRQRDRNQSRGPMSIDIPNWEHKLGAKTKQLINTLARSGRGNGGHGGEGITTLKATFLRDENER